VGSLLDGTLFFWFLGARDLSLGMGKDDVVGSIWFGGFFCLWAMCWMTRRVMGEDSWVKRWTFEGGQVLAVMGRAAQEWTKLVQDWNGLNLTGQDRNGRLLADRTTSD
jgi:hypothetical protein